MGGDSSSQPSLLEGHPNPEKATRLVSEDGVVFHPEAMDARKSLESEFRKRWIKTASRLMGNDEAKNVSPAHIRRSYDMLTAKPDKQVFRSNLGFLLLGASISAILAVLIEIAAAEKVVAGQAWILGILVTIAIASSFVAAQSARR